MITIAVIGAGRIGSALAEAWHRQGRDVVLGARRPIEATRAADETGSPDGIAVLGIGDALALAQDTAGIVVLAIPGIAVPELLSTYREQLAGALVIDASNSVGGGAMHHADAAATVPGLRYARAFNTLGVENFTQPRIAGQQADLFFAATSADRAVVESLITDVGLRPVYVGEGIDAADLLDGVTRLWFALSMGPNARAEGRTRHLAFRMLP